MVPVERIHHCIMKHQQQKWDFVSVCSVISNIKPQCVLCPAMQAGSCMGCCDPGAAVLQSWQPRVWLHPCCLCVPPPAPLAARNRGSAPGPALLPVSAPTSKLVWGYRGRCLCCQLPSHQLSQLSAGSGSIWHVHATWNGTAAPRLHFLGDWCVAWGTRYTPNEEQRSPFIKKFQPIQICLQGGAGRDATWNKCLL